MAMTDILAQTGDGQDFIVEIPAGNPAHIPDDVLYTCGGSILLSEIPEAEGGGGNIFIMSE